MTRFMREVEEAYRNYEEFDYQMDLIRVIDETDTEEKFRTWEAFKDEYEHENFKKDTFEITWEDDSLIILLDFTYFFPN